MKTPTHHALLEALLPFAMAYAPTAQFEEEDQNLEPKLRAFRDRNEVTPRMTIGDFRRAYETIIGYQRDGLLPSIPQPQLRPLSEGMPAPEVFNRVIIYTEGVDFGGQQYFHVKAEHLLPKVDAHPDDSEGDDRTEVCKAATHWMPEPSITPAQQLARDDLLIALSDFHTDADIYYAGEGLGDEWAARNGLPLDTFARKLGFACYQSVIDECEKNPAEVRPVRTA